MTISPSLFYRRILLMKYIKKITTSLGLLMTLSLSAHAGTALNCNEVDNMKPDTIEACAEQTDRHLNENYAELRKLHKDSPEKLKLLKAMQTNWIKMRDAQCEFAMHNTGSNAALAGTICQVKLTQKRSDELEEMAQ